MAACAYRGAGERSESTAGHRSAGLVGPIHSTTPYEICLIRSMHKITQSPVSLINTSVHIAKLTSQPIIYPLAFYKICMSLPLHGNLPLQRPPSALRIELPFSSVGSKAVMPANDFGGLAGHNNKERSEGRGPLYTLLLGILFILCLHFVIASSARGLLVIY